MTQQTLDYYLPKCDCETGKLCEDLRLKSFLRMLPSNDNESIMS